MLRPSQLLIIRSFLLILVGSTLLGYSVAVAQTTPDLEQGLKPYGSYDGGNIDSVNLSNGNLTLHVPLLSYPQRGGKLPLKFFIQYNNKGYAATPVNPLDPTGQKYWLLLGPLQGVVQGVSIAPELGAEYGGVFQKKAIKGFGPTGDAFTVYVCTLTSADGATHQLSDCPSQGTVLKTFDTSGILYPGSGGYIDRKGLFGGSLGPTNNNRTDTNGNYTAYNSTTNSFTDTLGRTLPDGQPLAAFPCIHLPIWASRLQISAVA